MSLIVAGLVFSWIIGDCSGFELKSSQKEYAVDLSGRWEVEGNGLSGNVSLPGTLCDAGLGREMTEMDYATSKDIRQRGALMRARQYIGRAVYSREFEVAQNGEGRSLELVLERVMWRSEVKIDGREFGWRDSLGTPHVYKIGALAAGRHRIEIAVDNSCFYGFSRFSHSYGPVMQSVWHGVLGNIGLRRENGLARARVFASSPSDGKFTVKVPEGVVVDNLSVEGLAVSRWERKGDLITVSLSEEPMGWNEFHPKMYLLTLEGDGQKADVRFAFRSIRAGKNSLYVNGVRTFMRGNVDNCNFAKTGSPAMTKAEWLEIFRRLKNEDGINLVRFHSWCPPGAAFEAADEIGIYLMPEAGIWTDRWMAGRDKSQPAPQAVGHGLPVDDFVKRELRDILDAYGNSPSFISLAIGNELGNSNFEVMGNWMGELRRYDPSRLYFASTARNITKEDDLTVTHLVPDVGWTRRRFFPKTDWDYEDVYSRAPIPVMAHEIGQWPVYPMWESLEDFDGALKAYNLFPYRRIAQRRGTIRFNRRFHEASAKANRLVYKEEVESFLRTPSCAGVQLLNVQDFTGQGEALVGWRDAFYELKPAFVNENPFCDIWGEMNFLARFEKFTWKKGEVFKAELQIRNLSEKTIPASTEYEYGFDGNVQKLKIATDIPPGELASVGKVEFAPKCDLAGKHTLRFGSNSWDFWFYPDESVCPVPCNVVHTADYLTAKQALEAGKTVLFTGKGRKYAKDKFLPVYWSVIHFANKNPLAATLGTWVDSAHPALEHFPAENWADWQWQSLVNGAIVHELTDMPEGYEPICLTVSDFHHSLFLSSLFEVKVGAGRLLVCGYDIDKGDLPSKRLRSSLMSYLSSKGAKVPVMTADWFASMFAPGNKGEDGKGIRFSVNGDWLEAVICGEEAVCATFRAIFGKNAKPAQAMVEGRPCAIRQTDKDLVVEAKVMREDMLDGEIVFRCKGVSEGAKPSFEFVQAE